jgi:hypothetical protein
MSWSNKEVEQVLALMGLPIDSPLSVLCVEMMPRPETYLTLINELEESITDAAVHTAASKKEFLFRTASSRLNTGQNSAFASAAYDSPLGASLGKYRILRTSPLTKVPYVCCT